MYFVYRILFILPINMFHLSIQPVFINIYFSPNEGDKILNIIKCVCCNYILCTEQKSFYPSNFIELFWRIFSIHTKDANTLLVDVWLIRTFECFALVFLFAFSAFFFGWNFFLTQVTQIKTKYIDFLGF